MQKIPYESSFYTDIFPNGSKAILHLDGRMTTHLGTLTPPAKQLPLYTCIATTPGFQIAGQANDSIGTSHFYDGEWHLDPRIAHGNFGCIFDLQGVLRIIEPAPDQTSQGYRYVWPDGTPGGKLWLGDETLLANEVSQFTDLSDAQDHSFLGGQGHSYPGIVVFLDGVHRVIHTGECYAPRFHRDGNDVSCGFYEKLPGGSLKAWTLLATVDELRMLPLANNDAILKPPKIIVHEWSPIIEAGVSWPVKFEVTQPAYITLEKDQLDRLQIGATNAAGSDHTGVIRQLTVKCPKPPEPEPEPLPMTRFIVQPNIGVKDLFESLEDLTPLKGHTVSFYVQEIHAEVSDPQLSNNIYPNFVAHDIFRRLKEAGISVNIEMGSIKPGDCQAQNAINGMQWAVQRVVDASGEISSFSIDEPLTANQASCHQSIEACADAHAAFTLAVRALGDIKVIYLEAWPEVSLADQQKFLQLLKPKNALPDAWRSDIDYNRAQHEHKDVTRFIRDARTVAATLGIPYGLFVNSTVDPIPTDDKHHANLVALAQKIHGIVPDIHHLCVAAWAHRVSPDPTHATQNVPNNLGTYGMFATFKAVREMFDTLSPPDPEPVPTPEVNPMLYKLMEAVIRIKSLKPSSASGKVLAITPDDLVGSVQPNGTFETRPSGTDAAYEQCIEAQNLLLYEPVPGMRYAYAYRIVP